MPPARLKARMDSLLSFPVGLFHPLQHAGLSRRSPGCRRFDQGAKLNVDALFQNALSHNEDKRRFPYTRDAIHSDRRSATQGVRCQERWQCSSRQTNQHGSRERSSGPQAASLWPLECEASFLQSFSATLLRKRLILFRGRIAKRLVGTFQKALKQSKARP